MGNEGSVPDRLSVEVGRSGEGSARDDMDGDGGNG